MKLLTFDQQDQQLHIAQNNITQLWPRNMNLLGLILKNKQKKTSTREPSTEMTMIT